MKKMLISLVIEGSEADIHTIKGNILTTASEALVSCSINEVPEQKRELEIPAFMTERCCDREQIKRCLNKIYGKAVFEK